MFTINRNILVVLFITVSLPACLNPYASEFTCPKTDGGKCVSVNDAYYESLQYQSDRFVRSDNDQSEKNDDAMKRPVAPDLAYQESLYKKMQRLLDDPVTPIVVPPTVLRVLFLPYPGDAHELYGYRYAFMFADEPRWLMGDYLKDAPGKDRARGAVSTTISTSRKQ